jgi:hypothetical protein
LILKPVPGFAEPASLVVQVIGGKVTTIDVDYQSSQSPLESWRQDNFGSPDNSGIGADGEDPDQDGQTNLDEYTAGTRPKDGADWFRVVSSARAGGEFSLTVQGKAGRRYVLQRRADLSSGEWGDLSTRGPLAADGPVNLSDPAATADRGFYRVKVLLP